MAFWYRKTVGGRQYLFIYTREDGRQRNVPRSRYRHLEGAADHNIEAWIAEHITPYEGKRKTPDHTLFSDDRLNGYLDDWCVYLKNIKGRADTTIRKYRAMLSTYVFPFFVERGLKDPGAWPGVSVKLYDYLAGYECSQALIAEINNALRGFYRWLQEEGLVAFSGALLLRNRPKERKGTSLAFTLLPEEVMLFAQQTPTAEAKVLALAGYFFSLRPQETFGLYPEDFAAGEDIQKKECILAMQAAGLYDGLALNVQRQQTNTGKLTDPKAHSKGWVACFNREAAHLLVEVLNGLPEDTKVFGTDNRGIYRRWERATRGTKLEKIDLKDLRRASLYWLGHHSKMQETPMNLMKHARHKEFDTTLLYLRRPSEEPHRKPGKLKLTS